MADQQPTVVKEGGNPLMPSHSPPPSAGQDAPDGVQQEKTAHSDSDSDSEFIIWAEFSTFPTSVMNGERIIINLW